MKLKSFLKINCTSKTEITVKTKEGYFDNFTIDFLAADESFRKNYDKAMGYGSYNVWFIMASGDKLLVSAAEKAK